MGGGYSLTSLRADLFAGVVGRPHGLDGSFHVSRPVSPLLLTGARVTIAGRERLIVRRAGTAARPIVRVDGCEDREAAAALRGGELRVVRNDAPELNDDEWWPEDLQSCRVRAGVHELGVVRDVLALPSCDVLEVGREGEPDLLVPLVRDAVLNVDLRRKLIEVDLRFLGEA
jgi:16S rRNA processing protein RimM